MNLKLYIIKEDFVAYIKEEPSFLTCIDKLSSMQQQQIIQTPSKEEIYERALHFFFKATIQQKENTIYYQDRLHTTCFHMVCYPNYILLPASFKNPFYPFLKRLYRHYQVVEEIS